MKYVYIAIALIVVIVGAFLTVKRVSPLAWGWWGATNTSSGVALKGYDPVTYFQASAPVQGREEFSFAWNDASWHFSSEENRDKFAANPAQFAPQFGGFCSFAVSKGFTADISPDAWYVHHGQLYLFADTNVRDDWVALLGDGSLQASEAAWEKR
jgi:YHS domain-containing protein